MKLEPAPTPSEGRWAHYLGHLLWDVSSQASQLGDTEFAGTCLTLASVGLLDQIGAEPGITIAEISRRVPKSPQAVSQVVARLEKLGYVERRVGAGRGVGLHVTERGSAARAEGNAIEQGFEERLRGWLGQDDYEELRQLLERARLRASGGNRHTTPAEPGPWSARQ